MKKKTIIIGIETSCDETAVSILRDNGKNRPKILSNVILIKHFLFLNFSYKFLCKKLLFPTKYIFLEFCTTRYIYNPFF